MDLIRRTACVEGPLCTGGFSAIWFSPMSRSGSPNRPFAARRLELGLSLHQAAARLHISPRYLRSLERGMEPLSLPLAWRMSVEYGSSIDALTRPVGAGGTGTGRGVSGNAPRPRRVDACANEEDPSSAVRGMGLFSPGPGIAMSYQQRKGHSAIWEDEDD